MRITTHMQINRNNVIFLDTDKLKATESKAGNKVQNIMEATLVYQVRNEVKFK